MFNILITFSGCDSWNSNDVMSEAMALGNKAEMKRRMFLVARSREGEESRTALAILDTQTVKEMR